MFLNALIAALTYHVAQIFDSLTGTQCFTRPIILGTLTGLVCGDLQTGIIMGAQLEAIYMGISAIGGVAASDYRVSTVVPVTLVILTGLPQETSLALSVTIGAIVNSLKPVEKFLKALYHPVFLRLEEERNFKAWRLLWLVDGLVLKTLVNTLIIFFSLWLGAELITEAINQIPAWILNGFNVASGMLVVVGLCLTTRSIWDTYTPVYVIIGFILSKFVGLDIIVIALLALAIVLLQFKRSKEMTEMKNQLVSAQLSEGDDFYE